ncbi:hypothetical protein K469DRAFT_298106 [Zopfia rhizophila CBS 207.26]|uniref:Bacteriophage T5 Orf172 DNA-binding domain-containing protein n=1 Tax=Zopfia rhizophila CBS 207.26 TaxID=1314779 RepID=A0A6A6DLN3_9PEZI|nr:hypothetical protein K469DRAFT_298106 [Zopfia rhizophila CBS 207.26]
MPFIRNDPTLDNYTGIKFELSFNIWRSLLQLHYSFFVYFKQRCHFPSQMSPLGLLELERTSTLDRITDQLLHSEITQRFLCLYYDRKLQKHCETNCRRTRDEKWSPGIFKDGMYALGLPDNDVSPKNFSHIVRTLFCDAHNKWNMFQRYQPHFIRLWTETTLDIKQDVLKIFRSYYRLSIQQVQTPSDRRNYFKESGNRLSSSSSNTSTRPRTPQPTLGGAVANLPTRFTPGSSKTNPIDSDSDCDNDIECLPDVSESSKLVNLKLRSAMNPDNPPAPQLEPKQSMKKDTNATCDARPSPTRETGQAISNSTSGTPRERPHLRSAEAPASSPGPKSVRVQSLGDLSHDGSSPAAILSTSKPNSNHGLPTHIITPPSENERITFGNIACVDTNARLSPNPATRSSSSSRKRRKSTEYPPLLPETIADNIRQELLKDVESKGFIYILRAPNYFRNRKPLVKIGITEDITRRIRALQNNCGFTDLQECSRSGGKAIPWKRLQRVEKLCHLELNNFRKTLQCNKGGHGKNCDTGHTEWFEVEEETAIRTVKRWQKFINQNPYGEDGSLREGWKVTVQNGRYLHISEDEDRYDYRMASQRYDEWLDEATAETRKQQEKLQGQSQEEAGTRTDQPEPDRGLLRWSFDGLGQVLNRILP